SSSRDFHLAHRDLGIPVGSWVAFDPNGTRVTSRIDPPRLGALLPSPRRAQTHSKLNQTTLINVSAPPRHLNTSEGYHGSSNREVSYY
ncbi:MAG: hypothetical protein QXP97_06520, partial [Desulfurococcus sp.]|uniref:hypothetical protein n=1 Tax=Desulfurococcus sp. TaxID=51678 RepID=UPI0031679911